MKFASASSRPLGTTLLSQGVDHLLLHPGLAIGQRRMARDADATFLLGRRGDLDRFTLTDAEIAPHEDCGERMVGLERGR